MGKNIPADRIVALVDWFVFDLNAAEVYMHLQCNNVCHTWLEKHIKDLGFPSLYDTPPMKHRYTVCTSLYDAPLINDIFLFFEYC